MALIGSLAMTEIYAQQTIVACNGKTYKQGDTLVVGKPASSGYLYMRSVDGQGSLSPVYERDIVGSKMIITSVPEYDKSCMNLWVSTNSQKRLRLLWLREKENIFVLV